MSEEKESKSLAKQLQKEIRKDKVIAFVKKHLREIKMALITIVVLIILFSGYSFYKAYQTKISSEKYFAIKESLMKGDNDDAMEKVDDLIVTGTSSYQFIAYVEKANIYVSQGLVADAILVLQEAYKNISISKEYKDIVKSMEFMLRVNLTDEDLDILKEDIKNQLKKKKDSFYFYNLEIYASILFMQENYQGALEEYNNILENDQTPEVILTRAKRAVSLIKSYLD